MLKISNVEKNIQHAVVFPSINLELKLGETAAIHSSTNVRTVLLELLSASKPLSGGSIMINNEQVSASNKVYFNQAAFLFLNDGLYERLTIKEHLAFYQKLYGANETVEEILNLIQLNEKKRLRVSALTFSEKKRLLFARILFQKPKAVILEEPDQNVDLEAKKILSRLIRMLTDDNSCVLVLTGNMESALMVTKRVYRLDESGLHALEVTEEKEEETLKEQNEEIQQVQPVKFEKIPTKVNDKIILFNPPEIDYIESSEGQSNVHVKGQIYPCMFTLNDLEQRLIPFGFFRCHRSYIVNLQKVREVITWTRNSYSLILDEAGKSSIPLSKTKMTELKEMLGLK
ncbi:LytTR family transcriptional regulator DNA-binding domain-containing protein [Jeotgalibacillus proteolyticus]|uniref:ABC transporter ATP-binding protein n=1 Tax=Jeotgalibacillus proteolyticus TaxID=2082395 RepID=A0A2S5GCW8_9BACL|nr:LytTR family transcriptional regulator DNA-binding domain-containing protein [Jeotgalibacillus proteolyticus]PPA70761.1 ABC transporter ATP-binding protein [Jeotgalibacillus proteolyticus]